MVLRESSAVVASVASLGDPGNRDAPPGSKPWAIAMRLELHGAVKDTGNARKNLSDWLKLMEQYEGWKQLLDEHGQPFSSAAAFCEASPPYGLGHAIEALHWAGQNGRSPVEYTSHGGDRRSEKFQVAISNLKGGTTADYLAARLKRDRPDILDKMHAGDYPSVHAAALDAGIVRPRYSIPTEPCAAARALRRHFDEAWLKALIYELEAR
jgi:hypothetical protein